MKQYMFDTWNIHHFQQTPSPLTSSCTLLEAIPPIFDTEQVYTPASLTNKLVISNADLPVLLMILRLSPRRNTLPSFSQRIAGSGTPVNVHTSSKRIPSVLVSGAGRSTMVGRAVEEKKVNTVPAAVGGRAIYMLISLILRPRRRREMWPEYEDTH